MPPIPSPPSPGSLNKGLSNGLISGSKVGDGIGIRGLTGTGCGCGKLIPGIIGSILAKLSLILSKSMPGISKPPPVGGVLLIWGLGK